MFKTKYAAFFLLVSGVIIIAACEKKGLAALTNAQLTEKNSDCAIHQPTAPGKATSCENVKRECAKRRKKGIHAC